MQILPYTLGEKKERNEYTYRQIGTEVTSKSVLSLKSKINVLEALQGVKL